MLMTKTRIKDITSALVKLITQYENCSDVFVRQFIAQRITQRLSLCDSLTQASDILNSALVTASTRTQKSSLAIARDYNITADESYAIVDA